MLISGATDSSAKLDRRSSFIVERSQVFKRRNIEKVLSAEAVVTGNVVKIFKRNLIFDRS